MDTRRSCSHRVNRPLILRPPGTLFCTEVAQSEVYEIDMALLLLLLLIGNVDGEKSRIGRETG